MTDRDVYEVFYRKYEPPDPDSLARELEDRRRAADEAHAKKPLAQRKREFWDLCKSHGCKEADTQRQWDAYLKGG